VRVNGVDVGLVADGGVRLDLGGPESVTVVGLDLMPSKVVIRHADEHEAAERPPRTTDVQWAVAVVLLVQVMSLLTIAAIA
jgi:hypothetical protein